MQPSTVPFAPPILDCIPDAGCQQFRVPLDLPAPSAAPPLDYSSCFCPSTNRELPWARCRPVKGDKGKWLLDLLIDSTLGTCERGYILHERRQVVDGYDIGPNPSRRNSSASGPYVAADFNGLRPEGWKDGMPVLSNLECRMAGWPYLQLQIRWIENDIPIPVDIAVDFGNTRTCVVAKESVEGRSVNDSLHPILFLKEGIPYEKNKGDQVADSYLVLRETPTTGMAGEVTICDYKVIQGGLFSRTKEVVSHVEKCEPHLFVQVSPVILGREAKERTCELDVTQGSTSLSSPKRYIGQSDPLYVGNQGQWMMLTKDSTPAKGKSKPLGGKSVRFLSENDRPWTRETPHRNEEFKDKPAYPRAQAMTWAALSIIEAAASQINSVNWRRGEARRRYLRNVAVTHPAGWTEEEIRQYRRRWREALDIFALTRCKDPFAKPADQGPPSLLLGDEFAPDEAVSAQLPIIYSEIHRLRDVGDNWLELYGRPQKQGDRYTSRVMSIDIGGGTTDIAIIEYADEMRGSGVRLSTRHLFGDSVAVAGDMVIEKILKEVIFPKLCARDQLPALAKYLDEMTAGAASNRGRYATLIWEPLVRKLLGLTTTLTEDETIICTNPLSGETLQLKFKGETHQFEPEIDGDQYKGFAGELRSELLSRGVESPASDFDIPVSEINRCWKEIFEPLTRSWAAYAAALEVDLLLISGKPSEQPVIRQLISDTINLPSPRVVFARNFEAGSWWPMGDKQIADAKHVTVVGLALYSAIQRGEEPAWAIKTDPGEASSWWHRNHWGKITAQMEKLRKSDIFLHPADEEATIQIQVGVRIARQLLKEGGHADFVYELRWRDMEKRRLGEATPRPIINATLRRKSSATGGEYLELVSAIAADGKDMTNDVELHLNTMVAKTHWRDSGRFSLAETGGH